jgi:hypothetical protein
VNRRGEKDFVVLFDGQRLLCKQGMPRSVQSLSLVRRPP